MKAADIITALQRRWPSDEYVHVLEAPLDPGRQGTKIDDLVISGWASRGYEVIAVEVKVSRSDLLREVQHVEWEYDWDPAWVADNPYQVESWGGVDSPYRSRSRVGPTSWMNDRLLAGSERRVVVPDFSKSHRWRAHADRFYIATTAKLAAQAKAENLLPAGWGLIGVDEDGGTFEGSKAARNKDRKPFTWPQQIGLLRSAQDAGFGVRLGIERRAMDAARREVAAELERAYARLEAANNALMKIRVANGETHLGGA